MGHRDGRGAITILARHQLFSSRWKKKGAASGRASEGADSAAEGGGGYNAPLLFPPSEHSNSCKIGNGEWKRRREEGKQWMAQKTELSFCSAATRRLLNI